MIVQRYLILLLVLSFGSALIAMDGQGMPTKNFKNKTKDELNTLALEIDVRLLTPRSKQSLEDRVKELGITQQSGDLIYTALASDGSRKAHAQDIDAFLAAQINHWNVQKRASSSSEQK